MQALSFCHFAILSNYLRPIGGYTSSRMNWGFRKLGSNLRRLQHPCLTCSSDPSSQSISPSQRHLVETCHQSSVIIIDPLHYHYNPHHRHQHYPLSDDSHLVETHIPESHVNWSTESHVLPWQSVSSLPSLQSLSPSHFQRTCTWESPLICNPQ